MAINHQTSQNHTIQNIQENNKNFEQTQKKGGEKNAKINNI